VASRLQVASCWLLPVVMGILHHLFTENNVAAAGPYSKLEEEL
jgi:hypothetical protein